MNSSPSAIQYRHERIYVGLDHAYCPGCKASFSHRTNEYKSALELPQAAEQRSERPPEDFSSCPPENSSRHTPASGWVEKYTVKRRWEYYRYCWQTSHKGKINRLHIPNDSGKLAAVQAAISAGRPPEEISQLLRKCSGGRSLVITE